MMRQAGAPTKRLNASTAARIVVNWAQAGAASARAALQPGE
jgi:hypothetical protein